MTSSESEPALLTILLAAEVASEILAVTSRSLFDTLRVDATPWKYMIDVAARDASWRTAARGDPIANLSVDPVPIIAWYIIRTYMPGEIGRFIFHLMTKYGVRR
jgi:hypothetical protein